MPRACKCCHQGEIEALGDLIKVCRCGYGHAPCMALGLPFKEAFYDLFYEKKDMVCLTCKRDIPVVRLTFFLPHRVLPAMRWAFLKCFFPLGDRAFDYLDKLSMLVVPAGISSLLLLSWAMFMLGIFPKSLSDIRELLFLLAVITGFVLSVILLGLMTIEFCGASFSACFARFLERRLPRRGNVWLYIAT